MSRIGRAAGILSLTLLTIGSPEAHSDEKPKPNPQAVDPVDRVLADWQAKASTIKSVEVKFHRTDNEPGWGQTRYEGRAILASPNLALVEFTRVGDKGKAIAIEERMIWNGRSIYQFAMDDQKVTRFLLKDEWPAAPSLLRLPFFYRMTVEEAKRDFAWELVKQEQERIILKVAPKALSANASLFRSCFIELDPKTFRPRWMVSTDAAGDGRHTYKPIDIKINTVVDTSELTDPCLDAWTVTEVDSGSWPARLFFK
jgi:outer membrane lipoprotein-sorting protein